MVVLGGAVRHEERKKKGRTRHVRTFSRDDFNTYYINEIALKRNFLCLQVGDEFGSVSVPGSKKQNLNHLLNFHYAPREGVMPGFGHWRSSPPGLGRHNPARWLTYTHKHKYNKEQFLQAK